MKTRFLLILVSACMLLGGCRLRRPSEVLSPKKMENILYDYHKAQAIAIGLPASERYQREQMYAYVYNKHGITKEEFETSLVWYTRNPQKLSEVYDAISGRIDKERKAISTQLELVENMSYSVMSGDTVDLWYQRRNQILTPAASMDKLLFEIPYDTSFYRNDILKWKFACSFVGSVPDTVHPKAYLSLSMVYSRDSVSTRDYLALTDAYDSIVVRTAPDRNLSRIRGMVVFTDCQPGDSAVLLLSGLELQRIHTAPRTPARELQPIQELER